MKYYCINLDKRADRWEKFKENFNTISGDLELIRVSGVEFNDPSIFGTRAACSAAHHKAISLGLESGEESFTVFEDDVFFYDYSKNLISKSLEYLGSKPWDFFYWGCAPCDSNSIESLSTTDVDFLFRVNHAGSAHAVTYSREFAKKFISGMPSEINKKNWFDWVTREIAFDDYLRKNQKIYLAFTPYKLCACQYNGYSDIDNSHNNRQRTIENQFNKHS